MTETILNLITWVDETALSLCSYFGVSAGGVVTFVVVAGLIAYLVQ